MKKRSLLVLLVVLLLCVLPATAFASAQGEGEPSMTHRMMLLVIQLGVIVFAARLGNIFFEKMHLPGVLGELIIGIIIGPYLLGQISFFGFSEGLFPFYGGSAISPELYGLSTIAAVVLLFTVGLETDLSLLLRYSVAGGLVGAGGVVFSFFMGAGTLMLFSESLLGRSVGLFAPVCLFAGVVATATSVGITARILSEKGKIDSPEGVTILSAAVFDDVIGIILLAVVIGILPASKTAGNVQWSGIGVVAVKAVGVWLAATFIGLIASRKISFLLKWFGQRTSIAIMALGMALILAGLFEDAGLAMIIGAYVMGLSLSKTDIKYVVTEKVEPIYEFLVPVFFCATGMQISLGSFGSKPVLLFGVVYAVTGLLSKVFGCGSAALLAKFNLRGAMRIGFGMAPRGEVGLIIAGIGLASGLLNSDLFAAMIIMVLVNTLAAPPALLLLFRSSASGVRKSVRPKEKAAARISFDFPSLEMGEFFIRKLADVFESEGFFVHALGHEQRLYRLLKGGTAIKFQRIGTNLTFDCDQADVPLVNTAMYEALAALEHGISGLKKPLNTQPIENRLQDLAVSLPEGLSLRDYLTPGLIEPKLKGDTKTEIIDELLALLARNRLLKRKDLEEARKAVWIREESMSTGLQYGVAIPHGKTDVVGGLVCAVGIKKQGVDFKAMDGKCSKIFFLTLSPRQRAAPHVQFMATVSQVLSNVGRRQILACTTAKEIYAVLTADRRAAVAIARPPEESKRISKFDLRDYLKPELLEPNLKGNSKQEIIDELLDMLAAENMLGDVELARQAVLARENQMSTGMEDGVAIPHGRTDAVENLVCAAGIVREGVDFGSADGKPTQIIVMAITPESGSDPYLQLAAAIIGVLHGSGRARVLAAKTNQELYNALLGETQI